MLCRGHAVFDTAKLIDGHIYQLGEHIDRFLWSSGKAGIQLPMTMEQMTRTILDTAAASNAANGDSSLLHLARH
jgi:4-amino-4-deoxychorismate lyase